MDVTGTNPFNQRSDTGGASALNQLSSDYSTFLEMLTAQISNQDPLEPMDSTTFVTQLAQLTQVEQSVQTNINLEGLAARLDSMALISGANLVGQQANVFTNTMVVGDTGGTVSYQLASTASAVAADFYDPTTGQLIHSISDLPTASETEHALTWDGRTASGQSVLAGAYEVRLRAANADGNSVETAIFRDAEIKEASLAAGEVIYLVDGNEYVTSENIRALR